MEKQDIDELPEKMKRETESAADFIRYDVQWEAAYPSPGGQMVSYTQVREIIKNQMSKWEK